MRGDFLDSVTAELRFKMEAGVSQLSSKGGREEGERCSVLCAPGREGRPEARAAAP